MYPGLLTAAILLALIGREIRHQRRRHEELASVRSLVDLTELGLPEAESGLEKDYQRMLERIREEQTGQMEHQQRRYDGMMTYYTMWAHQIKTPIAAMKLHLQNEDSALSRTMASELQRVEQYVEMVLVFLRLDGESTDYLIRSCDLDAIVRQVVKKFAREFIARKLRLNLTPLNTRVVTDEKWLSFVVEQVLSNALKYTAKGEVAIYMEEPKTLCIRDTGIGIAPEDLPRIFEQGYTGHNGRRDKQATGIGLYLCRRAMDNLGHRITASSVSGQGTTIRLYLAQDVTRHE